MKIAIFGGAFDPPHLGHVLCACYAQQVVALDALWVLPSAHHPYGKSMAPFDERLAMCRLAFAGLAGVTVREDERDNPSGRTFDLLEALDQTHPGTEWYLIGGSDTGRDLPQWYRGEELARRLRVIPVPRRGYDDSHPAALPAISSTAVREILARGGDPASLLPAAVAAYLATRGLYLSPR
jgi:nicotinate-nucleotide adenylyltransferase